MPEPEPDPGFTFVDRRRHVEGPTSPLAPPPPASPPPTAPASELTEPLRAEPRADLASLCVMLYSDALVHLGQVPDPATGRPRTDLDQARFAIDMLAMIEEKTEGNRTLEESAVLEEILGALRMAFVHASRGR